MKKILNTKSLCNLTEKFRQPNLCKTSITAETHTADYSLLQKLFRWNFIFSHSTVLCSSFLPIFPLFLCQGKQLKSGWSEINFRSRCYHRVCYLLVNRVIVCFP